jgi:hypothetical protein
VNKIVKGTGTCIGVAVNIGIQKGQSQMPAGAHADQTASGFIIESVFKNRVFISKHGF